MSEYKEIESKNNESNFIEYDVAIETYTNLFFEKYSNFDFKTTCFFEEFFNNYKHSNELIYDIWIKFYQNKINLCIITNNYSESFSDGRNVEEDKFLYSKNYITNTGDVENTIKQLLLFIYNLKYDYMYSKITDNI